MPNYEWQQDEVNTIEGIDLHSFYRQRKVTYIHAGVSHSGESALNFHFPASQPRHPHPIFFTAVISVDDINIPPIPPPIPTPKT